MVHLTIGEQRLLLEMLEKETVNIRTQTSFDSKKFYNAIAGLIKNGLAVSGTELNSNKKFYRLTTQGEILAMIIRDFKR
jgi:DNA-binding PadR family transcriptional regulator